MPKKISASEELRKKALEYRALTIEKYKYAIQELEKRLELFSFYGRLESQKKEQQNCERMLKQYRKDFENFTSIPEEMCASVLLDSPLLIGVICAYEKEKNRNELKQKSLLERMSDSTRRVTELSAKPLEELLSIAMENDRLEIEELKLKIADHEKRLNYYENTSFEAILNQKAVGEQPNNE